MERLRWKEKYVKSFRRLESFKIVPGTNLEKKQKRAGKKSEKRAQGCHLFAWLEDLPFPSLKILP